MNTSIVVFFVLAVVAVQINAQCLPYTAPLTSSLVATPALVQPNVANTLADTLSLLTVSSLLAEKLPLATCGAPTWPTCGCGSVGPYGYPYGPYIL